VVDALGNGRFASLRWTLVRAGLNSRGKNERPVASADWDGALNSWAPVSYEAMGRWMLEEASAGAFIHAAPLVSRCRRSWSVRLLRAAGVVRQSLGTGLGKPLAAAGRSGSRAVAAAKPLRCRLLHRSVVCIAG